MSIEQCAHRALLPASQFLGRQRVEELRPDLKNALERTGLAFSFDLTKGHQSGYWFLSARNDYVLTGRRVQDQAREVGLGFVDGYLEHVVS